jgi:hypothetical protein
MRVEDTNAADERNTMPQPGRDHQPQSFLALGHFKHGRLVRLALDVGRRKPRYPEHAITRLTMCVRGLALVHPRAPATGCGAEATAGAGGRPPPEVSCRPN